MYGKNQSTRPGVCSNRRTKIMIPKRLLRIPAVLALLLLASPAGLTPARAATLAVCPSVCTYLQIQPAIDAASSGDTISIAAGTYNGGIVVTKNLTLAGAGASSTTIKAVNSGGHVGTIT